MAELVEVIIAIGLSVVVFMFTIGYYLTFGYWEWDKKPWEIAQEKCKELLHPELNVTQSQLYEHCVDYPETYGVGK